MNWIEEYKKILSQKKRREIRDKITSRLEITSATFYNWVSGKTKTSPIYIEEIGKIMNEFSAD